MTKQGHHSHIYHVGVALFIHNTIPYSQITIDSPLQIVAARIQLGNKLVSVASIYIPGSTSTNLYELKNIVGQLPKHFLLLGDFNGHNQTWGDVRIDPRGRMLESPLIDENLNYLNDGSPTHVSNTCIDLSIVTLDIALDLDWQVMESVLSSDHYPILISYSTAYQPVGQEEPMYNNRKGRWDAYQHHTAWQEQSQAEDASTPRALLNELSETMFIAADDSVPKYIHRRYFPKT